MGPAVHQIVEFYVTLESMVNSNRIHRIAC
jgi:hypothetical protein